MTETAAAAVARAADGSVQGENYRITPLTPRVVRLEWSPTGRFEDRPSVFATQRPVQREGVRVHRAHGRLHVVTDAYRLEYDEGPFSTNGLQLQVGGGVSAYHSVWRYGQDLSLPAHREGRRRGAPVRALDGNLGGAARTLDEADGAIPLEPGISSTVGYAVIDDSGSMVFDGGRLVPREAPEGARDLYVFAQGRDHVAGLADLYEISGPQPLLPRFALGNWWSRFHRYSEASYLELMDRFRSHRIPFSVAVVDMDWHLTYIDPVHGSGWTGYTWNRELFADPARFQCELHERGMAVTLNVHPADGVRAFEDSYEAMCRALGRPADGEPIEFDAADPRFMDAYFEVLHRGLEELGTDFWWVDWQSGPYSRRDGLDPLWVLNHGHFEDSARGGGRPLTFSRYAGPGSHRYPVGFSGDSIISWDSLAFQPRFTAAGANIGYGWWSHDIGGHMEGVRDDELAARWVQFGVFSPIMRLHSGNSPFSGKEPWNFDTAAEATMSEHLRLRHRMLPYLHAMNHRAHHEGRPLVEPTYFVAPVDEAYEHQDQYSFGSQLLVAPIVRPAARDTRRASTDVYLPEGRWIDVFTHQPYRGGRTVRMHRDLTSIPVLLKAGGILPLAARGDDPWADSRLPDLEVLVAAGADNAFSLWEEPEDDVWVRTEFALDVAAGTLTVEAPERPFGPGRGLTVRLLGFDVGAFADLTSSHGSCRAEAEDDAVLVRLDLPEDVPRLVLSSAGLTTQSTGDVEGRVTELLRTAQVGYQLKERLLASVTGFGAQGGASWAAVGSAPAGHAPVVHGYDAASRELVDAIQEFVAAE